MRRRRRRRRRRYETFGALRISKRKRCGFDAFHPQKLRSEARTGSMRTECGRSEKHQRADASNYAPTFLCYVSFRWNTTFDKRRYDDVGMFAYPQFCSSQEQ